MISTEDTPFTFPSKGSLWIPLPVKAIKDLANTGHRPASRVLYALCLHLGKDLVAVFPSYKSISWYACVGENSIRKCLNILEFKGYISIEKKRVGRKFENHYKILRKTWYPDSDVKLSRREPIFDTTKKWICNTCWFDVKPTEERTFENSKKPNGFPDPHWKHSECIGKGTARLLEETDDVRYLQLDMLEKRGIIDSEEVDRVIALAGKPPRSQRPVSRPEDYQ